MSLAVAVVATCRVGEGHLRALGHHDRRRHEPVVRDVTLAEDRAGPRRRGRGQPDAAGASTSCSCLRNRPRSARRPHENGDESGAALPDDHLLPPWSGSCATHGPPVRRWLLRSPARYGSDPADLRARSGSARVPEPFAAPPGAAPRRPSRSPRTRSCARPGDAASRRGRRRWPSPPAPPRRSGSRAARPRGPGRAPLRAARPWCAGFAGGVPATCCRSISSAPTCSCSWPWKSVSTDRVAGSRPGRPGRRRRRTPSPARGPRPPRSSARRR